MGKFPEAHGLLLAGNVVDRNDVTHVAECEQEHLRRVHTQEYLHRLEHDTLTPKERTLLGLPPGAALMRRSRLAVEGTRLACRSALIEGIAANLAGGTHHAFADRGEGFCVLNDVAVAVRDLQSDLPRLRVFVADTDAHQGNGTHALLGDDPHVFTYSIHVAANYPSRKVPGSLDVGLERYVPGNVYLPALRETLTSSVEKFRPDLAIWISGADPHQNDRFGQMRLSLQDMMDRDELVLSLFLERQVPLVVLYGGGYNREPGYTARLHRNSIAAAQRAFSRRPACHEPARSLV
jgi:acetoin utilization deacetylase AcuC-like enzyme